MIQPMEEGEIPPQQQASETFTQVFDTVLPGEETVDEDVHQSETFTESLLADQSLDKENNLNTLNGNEKAPEEDIQKDASKSTLNKMVQLPLGRVKHIMKMDPDTKMASQEAVFLIAKVTELFVESLAKESFSYTSQNKKKTLSKPDVDRAIDAVDCLAFLEGALED